MKKILILSLIIIIIDQMIKLIITNNIELNSSINIIPNFFYLTNISNYGAAFNILEDKRLVLILFTTVAIGLILRMISSLKNISLISTIAYSLLIGGAFANLFDRIFHGYVIDYLAFKIGNYQFPIFNFADICVVIGASLIIIVILKESDKNAENNR